MKKRWSTVWLVTALVALSAAVYAFQILKFGDIRDTGFYFFQDLAFLPLQVAIVTIVLGKFFKEREKQAGLKKINMAVGAFFSEAGGGLLRELLAFCAAPEEFAGLMGVAQSWTSKDYRRAAAAVKKSDLAMDGRRGNLGTVKALLSEKRSFLIVMLGNPNLMEHDSFTDMIWAVFHLADELLAREDFSQLPDSDLNHLEGDMKRALRMMMLQWLPYMRHLQAEYPYLFSLEVRRNPFIKTESVVIRT